MSVLQKYFTVLYDEEENIDRQADSAETALQVTSAIEGNTQGVIDNANVEADQKGQEKKLNKEREVADIETAKTGHTLWFKEIC